MDMVSIINQMLVLFFLLLIGYVAAKCHVITDEGNKVLTEVVLNVSLPCTILYSVMGGNATMSGFEALFFMGMVIAVYVLTIGVAMITPKLIGARGDDAGLYKFMVSFANVGFMGYPVAQAIFGPTSVFYVALFCMAFNVLTYSLGVIFIAGKNTKIDAKLLITPALISTLVSIVLFLTGVDFIPAALTKTVETMEKVTTPVSMLVVGVTLASVPIKSIFNEWRVYIVTAVRLLLLPVLTWALFRFFIHDALQLGVLVVIAGMPVAAAAPMLTVQYGKNTQLAAKTVFISTVLSVVTIPLLVYLLPMG